MDKKRQTDTKEKGKAYQDIQKAYTIASTDTKADMLARSTIKHWRYKSAVNDRLWRTYEEYHAFNYGDIYEDLQGLAYIFLLEGDKLAKDTEDIEHLHFRLFASYVLMYIRKLLNLHHRKKQVVYNEFDKDGIYKDKMIYISDYELCGRFRLESDVVVHFDEYAANNLDHIISLAEINKCRKFTPQYIRLIKDLHNKKRQFRNLSRKQRDMLRTDFWWLYVGGDMD